MTPLAKQIQQLIQTNAPITFAEFMQHALYSQNNGYYCSNLTKFGEGGDFITAPELTPLFGQTLANEFQPLIKSLHDPIILEFGAGSGRLCVDILKSLDAVNCLPTQYLILEVSTHLKMRQQELIHQEIPHIAHLVSWISTLPKQAFNGIVVANEVLDAMPVNKFMRNAQEILECYITCGSDGDFVETAYPIKQQEQYNYVAKHFPNHTQYSSEVNFWLNGWFESCFNMLQQGVVFIIDYGFPRHEYYHPDRTSGTLMCHYQHTSHPNPLVNIGQQDITAHVDFTHVAEAAFDAGFHVAGYTNQAAFLLSNGLLNLLSAIDDTKERIIQQQAVKKLIQPDEMGELFKVIALTKNITQTLIGFQLNDKRASL